MTAKKGDWVRVQGVILTASDRTGNLPEDTRATDLVMWTKGFLQEETAQIGEPVSVKTYIGRTQQGILQSIEPHYDHDYGRCVPELLTIGRTLRAQLADYEKKLKEVTSDER